MGIRGKGNEEKKKEVKMKRSCAVVRCGVALCGKEGTRGEKKNWKPKGREVGSLKEEFFLKKKKLGEKEGLMVLGIGRYGRREKNGE